MDKEVKILEEEFDRDYASATGAEQVESLRVKYLGRKAVLAQLFAKIPALSKEERGLWGKQLNALKQKITSLLEEKLAGLDEQEQSIDLTFPSYPPAVGSRHILSRVNHEICSIFEKLGFGVIEGGEIEDEWHNFAALNIPLDHPSRDVFDTFYLDIKEKDKSRYLLRSHTSPSQIRVMRKTKPPFAVISPGRVYRPDEVDATHSFMFHQIEGFAAGEDISFAHLKGALFHFAQTFFSPDVQLRFRPHFFPFTEPSAEVDVSCVICKDQRPKTKDQRLNREAKCSVCKGKGWLEILGCGMIHPKVLAACGINAKKYRGFAFGMGVERIAMLKYQIDDIRLFYENDARFLEQFVI